MQPKDRGRRTRLLQLESRRLLKPATPSLEWALGRLESRVEDLTRDLDEMKAERRGAQAEERADKRTWLLVAVPSVLLLADILLRAVGGR